ncbi:neck protein [Porphyromonas phage phage019b_ATCC49417]|nr:hypothetical protein [Porphyromonas gingivalis]EOA11254.1 hypothetical protein A343_1872 [Porphyromonas gingivalis JCVI SC001]PDP57500.1 hypothetical protein CLI74_01620 [Porphyromonas gingivalis]SJL32883.1 hypothetical protein PGIN_ATCC49417_01699 [Porphyromonas gingivalis]SJL33476.1 hypothetical protein PGIN_AFR-5B1_00144 [Porphyromonas gingivalis]
MITDEMIKKEFIHRTVSGGLRRISTVQQRVAAQYFTGGTGRMRDFFGSVPVEVPEKGRTYYLHTLAYVRFLDIKYAKGKGIRTADKAALYNRVIWGVMYGSVLPTLKYGLTDSVRQGIKAELEAGAGNQE